MASPNGEAYERRREQVRRAQKSHRARKVTYVKTLESEISELRKENATQANFIRTLKDVLIANNIAAPTDPTEGQSPTATIEVGNRRLLYQEIHARFDANDSPGPATRSLSFSKTPPKAPTSQSSFGGDTSHSDSDVFTTPGNGYHLEHCQSMPAPVPVPTPSQSLPLPSPPKTTVMAYAHPQGLDSNQVGVNFVLALESPCLYHHRTLSPELLMQGGVGNGHRAMLSAPIMARAPSFSLNPLHLGFAGNATWSIPAGELESLLRVSGELGLSNEITPVQGWQWIKRHPRFARMSFQSLEELRRVLLPTVECHGFGAVIDQNRFEDLAESVLSSV